MMNQSAATSVETIRKSRLGGVSMTINVAFSRAAYREIFRSGAVARFSSRPRRVSSSPRLQLRSAVRVSSLTGTELKPAISGEKREAAFETLAKIEFDIDCGLLLQIRIGEGELPLLHDALCANAKTLRGVTLRIGVCEAGGISEIAEACG